jgi:ferredoxin--NADP+ reductase
MNRILRKEQLSDEVFRFRIEAPFIAEGRKPGQFVMIQTHDDGERIPLTIADADAKAGSITIVFQAVGHSTHHLADMKEGESIAHLVGPLGTPTHIEKFGTVVCVGGGIGVAPLYPIAQGMKQAGNRVIIILGARTKSLLIMEEDMRRIGDEVIVCTDDGSYGRKALVTEPLKEICERAPKPNLSVAIGPAIMMKFCAKTVKPYDVPIMVSLNTIMIDGTGMCGGCRVTVGGKTKFVCVDGPEFDGHAVDFEGMLRRMSAYRQQEQKDHEHCHLEIAANAAKGGRS